MKRGDQGEKVNYESEREKIWFDPGVCVCVWKKLERETEEKKKYLVLEMYKAENLCHMQFMCFCF